MDTDYFIDYGGHEFIVPSHEEFKRRVNGNFNVFRSETFPFCQYEFFDLKDGKASNVHSDTLSKSINDIRASIPIGQLAYYAQNGADAVMLKDGKYIDTELKTIEIDESKIVIGENNKLYYETSTGKRTLLDSALAIGFVVTNDYIKMSKNRPTYVVLRRKNDGMTIDAFHLDGDIIYREICKGDPDVADKSVILRTFLKEGSREPVLVDHVGWEDWVNQMKKSARYIMRTEKVENIKKEEAGIRNEHRKEIALLRDEEKELGSKRSQARRLIGRLDTLANKKKTKIQKYLAQLRLIEETIANERKERNVAIKRLEKLDEIEYNLKIMDGEIMVRIDGFENLIDESMIDEERRIGVSKDMRKIIAQPKK